MNGAIGLEVAACVLCLGLSFLMSGMEAGVAGLSRLRVRQQARAGSASAKALLRHLEKPEPFLWTLISGNTLMNFIAFGLIAGWLHGALGERPWWLIASLLAVALAFYGGFDLLPKMLFGTYPTRLCLVMARPFRALDAALRPLVGLIAWSSRVILRWTGRKAFTGRNFGTREELRFVMQESAGSLTSAERTMINRVLDLQTLKVDSVATPMDRVVCVEASVPLTTAVRVCREGQLTRLPVWEVNGGRRRVAGIMSLKTVLYAAQIDGARPVGDYLQPALYLDGHLRLEEALRRMQRSGQRLGVVLDREQREVGVVTLQDILKTIFGEISL